MQNNPTIGSSHHKPPQYRPPEMTEADLARVRGARCANLAAYLEAARAGARSHRDRLNQLIAAGAWTGEQVPR